MIPSVLPQSEEVPQAAGTAGLLVANPSREIGFGFSGRRSRSRSSVTSGSGSCSGSRSGNYGGGSRTTVRRSGGTTTSSSRTTSLRATTIRTTASGTAERVARVRDFITTQAQALLGHLANLLVAITQRTHQSLRNLLIAAAGMTLELVHDLSGGFQTNSFVAVIQSVDEGTHDFRVARAVTLAQASDRSTAVLGVAGSL